MIRVLLAAALAIGGSAMAAPQIAFTFDDLPAHGELPAGWTRLDVAETVINALKAGGVPSSYGFVNGGLVEQAPGDVAVLSRWRDSGNLLGNHTWSHPGLSNKSVADYETEIVKNEPVIAAGSSDWHWFRYPFLDEGKDDADRGEIRAFLAGRGYKIAPVTTGLNDWDYPAPYARCLARNDTAAIARLEEMYLKRAEAGFDYSRAMAKALYGRDIPYVLLLHVGAFQAHMLPKLIALYQAKGVRFIGVEKALKDPHYRGFADPSLPAPPRDLERALQAKGLQPPPFPDWRQDELAAICQ